MAIPMLKIRRPLGRLIFNMGISTPGKTVFLIETAPWAPNFTRTVSCKAWNTHVKYHSLEYKFDVMESHSDFQSNFLKEGLGAEHLREINKYKGQKYIVLEEV